jgi:hypothetical protein
LTLLTLAITFDTPFSLFSDITPLFSLFDTYADCHYYYWHWHYIIDIDYYWYYWLFHYFHWCYAISSLAPPLFSLPLLILLLMIISFIIDAIDIDIIADISWYYWLRHYLAIDAMPLRHYWLLIIDISLNRYIDYWLLPPLFHYAMRLMPLLILTLLMPLLMISFH